MTFRSVVFYIVILVLVGVVGYALVNKPPALPAPSTGSGQATAPLSTDVTSTATYSCDSGSTITTALSEATAVLTLSDGRSLTLPHVVSADGGQYKNGTTLFVTKGDEAFLQENGSNAYDNCLAGVNNTVMNGRKTFINQGNSFTFSYPQAFILSGGGIGYTQNWKVSADNSMGLSLAKVHVSKEFEPKTNFGDATFTVGTSSDPQAIRDCLGASKTWTLIGGTPFTTVLTSDAGAGNRYDTTSYRAIRNNQCYAIEYTIHYVALANFPPNSGITAYDQKKVQAALESIVQSFHFLP
jgi:membrane-bound inhibitor of C-type lysozyme